MKKLIQAVIIFLALGGALNYGLLGLLNLNIVVLCFGDSLFLIRFVYLLMGLSLLYLLLHPNLGGGYIYQIKRRKSKLNHDIHTKQVINQDSPSIKEQENFISEGGNSQSLGKDEI